VTRLLGIDLGERRIGVAVADGDGSGARPLTTLRRGRDPEADAAAIERLMIEQDAHEIVVGLPLEASGEEGPMAQLTRAWSSLLAARLQVPVALRDERLSSHLAEQRLGPMKRGRSGGPPTPAQREVYRSRVDREAAAIILQDELDARMRAAAGAGPSSQLQAPPESSVAMESNE
jgi:putative Holliday junction resolvase